MTIEKSLQEIMKTALEHANPLDPAIEDWEYVHAMAANPLDPAIEDWQYVHAMTYDLLRGLKEEVEEC